MVLVPNIQVSNIQVPNIHGTGLLSYLENYTIIGEMG